MQEEVWQRAGSPRFLHQPLPLGWRDEIVLQDPYGPSPAPSHGQGIFLEHRQCSMCSICLDAARSELKSFDRNQ